MRVESGTLDFLEQDLERSRATFRHDLLDIRVSVSSQEDDEDRQLLEGMCDDLENKSKRYVVLVATFVSGTPTPDLDHRRRIAHEGIISTLHPLCRALGGEYQKWWDDPSMNGGINKGDRDRVGQWALQTGIDAIRGELLHEQLRRSQE